MHNVDGNSCKCYSKIDHVATCDSVSWGMCFYIHAQYYVYQIIHYNRTIVKTNIISRGIFLHYVNMYIFAVLLINYYVHVILEISMQVVTTYLSKWSPTFVFLNLNKNVNQSYNWCVFTEAIVYYSTYVKLT